MPDCPGYVVRMIREVFGVFLVGTEVVDAFDSLGRSSEAVLARDLMGLIGALGNFIGSILGEPVIVESCTWNRGEGCWGGVR